MNTPHTGGLAFSHAPYSVDSRRWSDGSPGMSLRAYIATAALQGLVTGSHASETIMAQTAIRFADALIAELNKPTS
jgi:hypothetical protein